MQRSQLMAKRNTLACSTRPRGGCAIGFDVAATHAKRPRSDLNFPETTHVKEEISEKKEKRTGGMHQQDKFQRSVQERKEVSSMDQQ